MRVLPVPTAECCEPSEDAREVPSLVGPVPQSGEKMRSNSVNTCKSAFASPAGKSVPLGNWEGWGERHSELAPTQGLGWKEAPTPTPSHSSLASQLASGEQILKQEHSLLCAWAKHLPQRVVTEVFQGI